MPKKPIILNGHVWNKGVFVAPFNTIPNLQLNHWAQDRLPEYLWIALIIQSKGRDEGLKDCYLILKFIVEKIDADFGAPLISKILDWDEEKQLTLYEFFKTLGVSESLNPLTIFLIFSNFPIFAKSFFNGKRIEDRINHVIEVLKLTYDHQSNLSTDVRFIVLWSLILSKKMQFSDRMTVEAITNYHLHSHEDEIMRSYRPLIRSAEGMAMILETGNKYMNSLLWSELNKMTDCSVFLINPKEDSSDSEIILNKFKELMQYFDDLLKTCYVFDIKANVLIGLLSYSFKSFQEMTNKNLFNSISGRMLFRAMIESYALTHYLLDEERMNSQIWEAFKEYGAGAYKLIYERAEASKFDYSKTHLQKDLVKAYYSSEKDPLFTNMDTNYFMNISIREILKKCGKEYLYNFYDYASSFEHCLWCSIKEFSLAACDNPSHKYHNTINIDKENNLMSVYTDVVNLIHDHVELISSCFDIPDTMKL